MGCLVSVFWIVGVSCVVLWSYQDEGVFRAVAVLIGVLVVSALGDIHKLLVREIAEPRWNAEMERKYPSDEWVEDEDVDAP